jgi:multiple sugar transport system ATP-binding protein
MARIEIAGLQKRFGPFHALRDIDLTVEDGEFTVLVGPSGCGKSTLLRVIAGLEDATEGELRIGGRRVNEVAPRDRDIAMVFQSYALYPHLDVARNVGYPLAIRRFPRERIGAAVAAAAETLGLGPLLDRRPRALSGGQRQRVAMGRAIVRDPKAFLFDEPLSNLDARLREAMRIEIGKLHRKLGATSVYVTHDQIEAMTMADTIVAMEAGRIQQVGTPLELYDDPASVFVGGFIGAPAMAFLDVEVAAEGSRLALRCAGHRLVALPPHPGVVPGDSVTLGIRPEHVALAGPDEGVPAVVDYTELTGLATIVHADLGTARLRAYALDRPRLRTGETVHLRLDPAKALIFDARSGRRVKPAAA